MINSNLKSSASSPHSRKDVYILRVPNVEKYDSMLRDQAYLDYIDWLAERGISAELVDMRETQNLRLLDSIPEKSKVVVSVLRTEQLPASFKICKFLKFQKQCVVIYGRLNNSGAFSTPYFDCREHRSIDYVLPSKTAETALERYLKGDSSYLINNRKKETHPAKKIHEIDINELKPSTTPANNSFITYEQSRGCTNRCFYCSNSLNKFQTKPIDTVVEEIRYLRDLNGTNKLVLISPEINFSIDYLREFVTKLEPLGMEWTSYCVPKGLDEDILTQMYKSGCRLLSFGVESANQNILSSLSKKTDINEISKIFSICGRLGINTQMHVIVGFPYETDEDIARIKSFITEHKDDITNVNISDLVIPKDSIVTRHPDMLGIELDKSSPGEFYTFAEKNRRKEDKEREIQARIKDLNEHITRLKVNKFNISTTFDESFERLYLEALSLRGEEQKQHV